MVVAVPKFIILMNKINLFFLCSVFIFGFKNKNLVDRSNLHTDSISILHQKDSVKKKITVEMRKENLQSEILPDTTINDKIKLNNYGSIELFTQDYKSVKTIERIRESPVAAFVNSNGVEYLLASQYEGNTKNSFSLFEIGYVKDIKQKIEYNKVDERTFETESGIHLGQSFRDLIQLKGDKYQISVQTDTVVTYRINDYKNSQFLKKYNMPGYFLEFRIKNAKICNFKFGFDYP